MNVESSYIDCEISKKAIEDFEKRFIAKCTSPEGKARAERARQEYREGKFYIFDADGWRKNPDWPKEDENDPIRQVSKAEDVQG